MSGDPTDRVYARVVWLETVEYSATIPMTRSQFEAYSEEAEEGLSDSRAAGFLARVGALEAPTIYDKNIDRLCRFDVDPSK